jgi:hypothetical protein
LGLKGLQTEVQNMSIELTPRHFSKREEAIAEINSDGLRCLETEISPDQLAREPHAHPYSVDIYMLEGELELYEPDTGRTHRLEVGTKAVVPAQTLHKEFTPAGFRALVGLSQDQTVSGAV